MVPIVILAASCGSKNEPAPAAQPNYAFSTGVCYLSGQPQPTNQACLNGTGICYVNGSPNALSYCQGTTSGAGGYQLLNGICYQNNQPTNIPAASCPVGTTNGVGYQIIGSNCTLNGQIVNIPLAQCGGTNTTVGGYQFIGGVCTLNGQQVSQALCGQQAGQLQYTSCNGRYYYAPYGFQYGTQLMLCYLGGCQGPGYYTLDYQPVYCM